MIIAKAKQKGLPVTCEVAPHHLFFVADDVPEHVRNVRPPLGTREDQRALWAHMHCIDCFATDHG